MTGSAEVEMTLNSHAMVSNGKSQVYCRFLVIAKMRLESSSSPLTQ